MLYLLLVFFLSPLLLLFLNIVADSTTAAGTVAVAGNSTAVGTVVAVGAG
ncbi:hypothetical protein [Candidatus Cardinium hertigii]|uniref:Uncharacterized protein n=1 Tax=Candidatus Cardinium hertigii TaxID=247481 RepID=A0A2Z3LIE0_9BACT|nr:hypothetical protein [Candidatus Cardinium hertigii]AWN82214.1 hypothetical protein DK880_00916 [Candidatus Cardinium hertigii]